MVIKFSLTGFGLPKNRKTAQKTLCTLGVNSVIEHNDSVSANNQTAEYVRVSIHKVVSEDVNNHTADSASATNQIADGGEEFKAIVNTRIQTIDWRLEAHRKRQGSARVGR